MWYYSVPRLTGPALILYSAPAFKVAALVAYAQAVFAEEFTLAQSQYSYGVSDLQIGDSKSWEEHREGDVVNVATISLKLQELL